MGGLGQTRRLRLGIEMLSGSGWTGGAQYIRNLIYCLAALPEQEQPIVRLLGARPDDSSARELAALSLVQRKDAAAEASHVRHVWRLVQHHLLWARGNRQSEQEPSLDATYPGFGRALPGVAQIKWLPDLQHVHLPHFFSADELKSRTNNIAAFASRKGILVLSSKAALADFLEIHARPVVTPAVWSFCTILTAHEEGGRNPHEAYGLPPKFAYLPNQFWAHKNHITVFKALAELRQRGIAVPLVCTGLEEDRRNPDHFPRLMRFLADHRLDGQVRCLGLVPRNDQIEIFRHATLVVQPSLFEGWSTVVEDTKAVGRPIIVSDLAVHKEQLASYDAAWFYSRSNVEDLARVIERVWPQLREGKDPAREQTAALQTQKRCRDAAREFIAIAWRAKAIHDAGE